MKNLIKILTILSLPLGALAQNNSSYSMQAKVWTGKYDTVRAIAMVVDDWSYTHPRYKFQFVFYTSKVYKDAAGTASYKFEKYYDYSGNEIEFKSVVYFIPNPDDTNNAFLPAPESPKTK